LRRRLDIITRERGETIAQTVQIENHEGIVHKEEREMLHTVFGKETDQPTADDDRSHYIIDVEQKEVEEGLERIEISPNSN